MKKILRYLAVSAFAAMFFVSCSSEKEFNKEFLYSGTGRWHCAQYPLGGATYNGYEIYYSNGTGKTWVEEPGITEADANTITQWTLDGETLTQRINLYIGGTTFATFQVSELTATKMVYSSGGRTYVWTKQ